MSLLAGQLLVDSGSAVEAMRIMTTSCESCLHLYKRNVTRETESRSLAVLAGAGHLVQQTFWLYV